MDLQLCVCPYVCSLPSSVLLFMLRAMTHAMKKEPRDKQGTSQRPPAGLESWGRGRGSLTSILQLIHYCLYMSKRLPSADSVERVCDAFVHPLSPKGSATLPFLTAKSKPCYLE